MKPEELKRLMAKKKDKPMSDNEKQAKMSIVKKISSDMGDMMKEKLGGLKKVTVASDSPDGLEKGLEKAKEMIGGHDSEIPNAEGEESPEHSIPMGEESEDEESEEECEPQSEEEIDAQIQELLQKKAELKK